MGKLIVLITSLIDEPIIYIKALSEFLKMRDI